MTESREYLTAERVLVQVAADIRTVMGTQYPFAGAITMDTSFAQDLDLESIELVSLGERLEERYAPHLDFGGWLSDMELDEIIGLTVGEIVSFVLECLESRQTA
jgi:acyl carrier protein